jgi:zinc protease
MRYIRPTGKRPPLWAVLLFLCVFGTEAGAGAVPQPERQVLSNGLVLVIARDHTLPFVTLRFIADAGARHDPPELAGLSNIAAEGLLLGTARRTERQINQQLDFLGASLSVSGGPDFTALDFRLLKNRWADGIDILLDVITGPTFPEKAIERRIRAVQSALVQEEDQPGVVTEKAFQKTLFRFSPYGHAVEGTIASLENIRVEQVRQFYERFYSPGRSILVIVGDIAPNDVRPLIERLQRWEGGGPDESPPHPVFSETPADVMIDRPVTQANIIMGHRGIARANPDFYAVSVMNQILGGGGFTSRLVQRVRVEQGLAYSVVSYFDPRRFPGAFQIELQTGNATARQAIDIAHREMLRMQQEAVSEQELNTAKNYLIGSFPLRYASQAGLARLLAHVEYHRLGADYFEAYPDRIRNIEKEDVLAAARTYLKPDETVMAVVADLKAAGLQP